jgi:hypothetical protein
VERQSILGSAYKRKAIVQLLERHAWKDIQPTLALARDAYARGAGEPDSPDWDPYGLINRLQLDALLGNEAAVDASLIAKCQDAARSRFDQTGEFFDAIKPVDASLALWLADTRSLGPDPGAELKSLYRDAVHQLYRSALEFDSVVTQLNLWPTSCAAATPTTRAAPCSTPSPSSSAELRRRPRRAGRLHANRHRPRRSALVHFGQHALKRVTPPPILVPGWGSSPRKQPPSTWHTACLFHASWERA